MEMNLQNIYFIVGVVGFVLAAIFAALAIAYFVRADIRGVRAELSGKARQAGLAAATESRRSDDTKRNVLTQDDSWKGVVSRGVLSETGGDTAGDGLTGGSESGTGSDWSFSDTATPKHPVDSDNAETEVDESSGEFREDAVLESTAAPREGVAADAAVASGSFSITRRIVLVHSANVVDEQGVEVAYKSPSPVGAGEGGR